jgi:predicted nuclease of restriction endonuclease-like (RecB) superfamily
MKNEIIDQNYTQLVNELKAEIESSRTSLALEANKQLLLLYHRIGSEILKCQEEHGWGAKVIEKLSRDLQIYFPDSKGFSSRNLKYMRKFAKEYSDSEFVQEVLARLSWYHHVALLDKLSEYRYRLFYIKKAIENNWSRNAMVEQIKAELHLREGRAITNFKHKLSADQAAAVYSLLKDPYLFDFLNLTSSAVEKKVEDALVLNMEKFLLELGAGFTFVARQYHIKVGDNDFYIDLLLYHLTLRCYVVVELKDKEFKPEHAGKMNFYLSAVDDFVRQPKDNPSVGLILCKSKDNFLAQYALRDMSKPIGLAQYKLTNRIPEKMRAALPTVEELEKTLTKLFCVEDKTNV